jgi:hypothetical protein
MPIQLNSHGRSPLLVGDRPGKIGSFRLRDEALDRAPLHTLPSLPTAHTETEGRSGIEHRHSEEEASGGRGDVSDRRGVHVALHCDRAVAMLDINRPGRRIIMVNLIKKADAQKKRLGL